jgi:CHRD domain
VSRRKLQLVLVVGVMSLLAAVGVAVATCGRDIRERLTGYEEDPQTISSPASGEFKASVNRFSKEIEWRLSYRGFPTNVLQAHIHFGGRHQSGGISVFLCTNLGNGPAGTQACPVTEGTIRGTIRPADVIGPTGQGIGASEFDEFVDAVRAGVTYANVHSQQYPGGELRAQLSDDDDHDRD